MMAKTKNKITLEDVPRLLASLSCGEEAQKKHALALLCPCRNKIYDRTVWKQIFQTYDIASQKSFLYQDASNEQVCNQAAHAIETLHEFARCEEAPRELLEWLRAEGVDTELQTRRDRRSPLLEKVTARNVPEVLRTLASGDAKEQTETLTALCPCRNRLYDREVWRAIFLTYHESEVPQIRDQAWHAIGTLLERARRDLRSQTLLAWLICEGIAPAAMADSLPVWMPNLRGNGLYIPRFEPGRRSRTNRRR